jgi:uncharacterized protein with PQ loop repeat
MGPDPKPDAAGASLSDSTLKRLLGGMSVFTMAMTIPQVWTIWVDHRSSGVSLLSWGAYLFSAALWLWHGLRERDKNIWLPCVGWLSLDLAVIAGVLVQGQ